MGEITRDTSLEQLAALVSQALEQAGITATLSGGGAVTLYSENEYQSLDLDFVTRARNDAIARALDPLGFRFQSGTREFSHPRTEYFVEFPPGPLGFGETTVPDSDATTLQTRYGPLRIITPTQSVMDRLSAYLNWKDNQAFDQAAMVASRHDVDWDVLGEWARREQGDDKVVQRLRRKMIRY